MDRLLGRESPVKATPARIAEDIAAVVVQQADRLMAELRKSRAPQHEAVFMGECLIFSAFPFDVMICAEFGTHGDVIRGKLRERLFLALQGVMDGLPMEQFTEFAAHFQEKADEYIKAWKSAEGSLGLERLGRAAGQAIYGPSVELGATAIFACSIEATAAFSFFKGFSSKYEVVTG